ncbi:hypothetical protein I4U23_006007 [Adineta vaga]|nr:hypothetical protein I4U23_006007 [Adineta vaga]
MLTRQIFLCLLFVLIEQTISQDIRAIDISISTGVQFHCINTTCLPFSITIVSDIYECQVNCLAKFQCKAARFYQLTFACSLFGNLYNYNGTLVPDVNSITMIVSVGTRSPLESEGNWIINGDGETGLCEMNYGVTHPTGWTYSGQISQVKYGNIYGNQKLTDPGPK